MFKGVVTWSPLIYLEGWLQLARNHPHLFVGEAGHPHLFTGDSHAVNPICGVGRPSGHPLLVQREWSCDYLHLFSRVATRPPPYVQRGGHTSSPAC